MWPLSASSLSLRQHKDDEGWVHTLGDEGQSSVTLVTSHTSYRSQLAKGIMGGPKQLPSPPGPLVLSTALLTGGWEDGAAGTGGWEDGAVGTGG